MFSSKAFLTSVTTLFAVSLAAPAIADLEEPIPVVATFSILGDMVQRIGGGHVAVTTLVGPDGDTHVYQPNPADARSVSEATVLVVNGLEFEGWLDRLVDASDYSGVRVVASTGIELIALDDEHDDHDDHDDHVEMAEDSHDDHDEHGEDGHDHEHEHDEHAEEGHDHDEHAEADAGHDHHHHGEFDPHGWQSLRNALTYVDNITAALVEAAPEHEADFYRNRATCGAGIMALDAEIRGMVSGLPEHRRVVVTSHDAFQYFGRAYGLTFLAPQGMSTESEASAKDVAGLIRQIRELGIRAVFVESITDPRLLERIADETGAAIGGTLYPGALSGPDGPAPTYLDMMRHNATTLVLALDPQS